MRFLSFVIIAFACATSLSAQASSSASKKTKVDLPAAPVDMDWQLLDAAIKRKPRHPQAPETSWASLAEKAREFQEKYPNDARAGQSRKLEVTALLNAQGAMQAGEGKVSKKIKDYLADQSIPAGDRFDIAALAKETELARASKRGRSQSIQLREKHARELLKDFPQEPRAYGYLLSVGNAQEGPARVKIAREVLASNAPEQIKATARRTLSRQDLEGKELKFTGFDVKKYKGAPLVVYTWTKDRPDILNAVRVWAKTTGVTFVGVNLDENFSTGKLMVADLKPPGEQLYLGGGLQGAVAQQLQLIAVSSVYLVDRKGVVADVDGSSDPLQKIGQLAKKEGKP